MKKSLSEMSRDELQTLYETVKAADDALLTELFGEGDAVRYKHLVNCFQVLWKPTSPCLQALISS